VRGISTTVKAGPAGGRLRRPSSRRQRHGSTGATWCARLSHQHRLPTDAIGQIRPTGWLRKIHLFHVEQVGRVEV
jgi:hypothetical protein